LSSTPPSTCRRRAPTATTGSPAGGRDGWLSTPGRLLVVYDQAGCLWSARLWWELCAEWPASRHLSSKD
jgi:hypothetical protein